MACHRIGYGHIIITNTEIIRQAAGFRVHFENLVTIKREDKITSPLETFGVNVYCVQSKFDTFILQRTDVTPRIACGALAG